MPPNPTASFEHEAIKADMERLAAEVKSRKEKPEFQGTNDKEILKHALRATVTSPLSTSDDDSDQTKSPLPEYVSNASPETKLEIEYLVDMALTEGIQKANSEATKSNPFVLDAFHDTLAGKLYPELERRGMLK